MVMCSFFFSEDESIAENGHKSRAHKKEKKHKRDKHKHKHKHKTSGGHSKHDKSRHSKDSKDRHHRHKHKHKKHKRHRSDSAALPELPGGGALEDTNLADLEQARAILAAQLDGQQVEPHSTLDENVISAMSLIAQGYQSESEEEGEVDHEDIKQTYIESGLNQIQEMITLTKDSSAASSEHSVVIEAIDKPDDDLEILDIPPGVTTPVPPVKRRRFMEDTTSRRSGSKERRRRSPSDRSRGRRPGSSSSPGRRGQTSLSPSRRAQRSPPRKRSPLRDKENRSPAPRSSRTRDDYDCLREAHNRGERMRYIPHYVKVSA